MEFIQEFTPNQSYEIKTIHDESQHPELLTPDQTFFLLQILMFGVTPTISLLGVVGNIFSIIILKKQGLHKTSNILLVSLAFSDILFLIGFNSVPKLLYEMSGPVEGFRFEKTDSYVLYLFHHVFNNLDYASGGTSLTLPMLITFERLVAVFLPLKFNLIITPARTWAAVFFINVFWYAFFIHLSFYVTLTYAVNKDLNVTLGLIERSQYHADNPATVAILEDAMTYLVMKIPPIVTIVGCVLVGIKVKLAASRRLKMTSQGSKKEKSNRTTKMLLAVCVVYTIACAVLNLPNYIPQYMYYTMTSDAPSNLGKVMYQVMNIALCINSSCNFIVYVIMNKNFRRSYKELFTCHQKQ
ncbi:FMRFamide receptor-like [Physella acuta]|uniref:FMRFamide receptor-like n=1 Tax=Physella acuta TaxID=109671 RepID=UPI0027DDF952|nr:FMRFamide receptor-like [Physella acuta]